MELNFKEHRLTLFLSHLSLLAVLIVLISSAVAGPADYNATWASWWQCEGDGAGLGECAVTAHRQPEGNEVKMEMVVESSSDNDDDRDDGDILANLAVSFNVRKAVNPTNYGCGRKQPSGRYTPCSPPANPKPRCDVHYRTGC